MRLDIRFVSPLLSPLSSPLDSPLDSTLVRTLVSILDSTLDITLENSLELTLRVVLEVVSHRQHLHHTHRRTPRNYGDEAFPPPLRVAGIERTVVGIAY